MRVRHRTPIAITTAAVIAWAVSGVTGASQATLTWTPSHLRRAINADVRHVTEVLLRDNGQTIWAAYYDARNQAHLARSSTRGASWTTTPIPGLSQVRVMTPLGDGSVLFGGASSQNGVSLVKLRAGTTGAQAADWQACAAGLDAVWDLVQAPDGALFVATNSSRNDPRALNRMVLRSTDQCATMTPVAGLPGHGVLSLALDARGRLYAATEESAEHDNAETAGQARIFYSDTAGATWTESGPLTGANRVYRVTATRAGTVFAGTGLRGEFFRSTDRGVTWTRTTHIPTGTRPFGDPPTPRAYAATRIYSILELQNGWILVGSGNETGDLFLTADEGDTWIPTGDTGPNLVCWALAQAPDGTIWIGTGSQGGDVLQGRLTDVVKGGV